MALATGCVVAGALLTSSTGRSVMTSAASNTAQHILSMVLGIGSNKEKNFFLSSRIQAKLECIMYLFKSMQQLEEEAADAAEASVKETEEEERRRRFSFELDESYEKTMWSRVFKEMASISRLVMKMKIEQEQDKNSWGIRAYWPRSQTSKQMSIIGHLETIEEIIRFVSMVTPYINDKRMQGSGVKGV